MNKAQVLYDLRDPNTRPPSRQQLQDQLGLGVRTEAGETIALLPEVYLAADSIEQVLDALTGSFDLHENTLAVLRPIADRKKAQICILVNPPTAGHWWQHAAPVVVRWRAQVAHPRTLMYTPGLLWSKKSQVTARDLVELSWHWAHFWWREPGTGSLLDGLTPPLNESLMRTAILYVARRWGRVSTNPMFSTLSQVAVPDRDVWYVVREFSSLIPREDPQGHSESPATSPFNAENLVKNNVYISDDGNVAKTGTLSRSRTLPDLLDDLAFTVRDERDGMIDSTTGTMHLYFAEHLAHAVNACEIRMHLQGGFSVTRHFWWAWWGEAFRSPSAALQQQFPRGLNRPPLVFHKTLSTGAFGGDWTCTIGNASRHFQSIAVDGVAANSSIPWSSKDILPVIKDLKTGEPHPNETTLSEVWAVLKMTFHRLNGGEQGPSLENLLGPGPGHRHELQVAPYRTRKRL